MGSNTTIQGSVAIVGGDTTQGGVSTVTLTVTPPGMGTVQPSEFLLGSAQYPNFNATFTYYPSTVSQKLDDVKIHAYCDGIETGVTEVTNVAVKLTSPDVNGEDTPMNMPPRISVGEGNWGSYCGTLEVAPNLMGVVPLNFTIQDANNDTEYGAAAVDPSDAQRATVATDTVFRIYGTQQEATTATGSGGSAELSVSADLVGAGPLRILSGLFAVKDIPTVVKACRVTVIEGGYIPAAVSYFWGARYDLVVLPGGDGAASGSFYISEKVTPLVQTGVFKGGGAFQGQTWVGNWFTWYPASFEDYVGLFVPALFTNGAPMPLFYVQGEEKQAIINADNQGGSNMTLEQSFYFSDVSSFVPPYAPGAHVWPVVESGFRNTASASAFYFPNLRDYDVWINVQRKAQAVDWALAGLLGNGVGATVKSYVSRVSH